MAKKKQPVIAVVALEGDDKGRRPGDVIRTFDGGVPAGTLLPAGNSLLVDPDATDTPAKRRDLVLAVLTRRADAARAQAQGMKRLTSKLTVEAMSSDPLDPATAGKHAKARAQVKESLAAEDFATAAQARLDAARGAK
ncbi:MAG: hypothetical protein ABFD92_16880 [Planctomycetaceae bacterium]|nr:hypothetical protein [Planctomycetaceae bacterium]